MVGELRLPQVMAIGESVISNDALGFIEVLKNIYHQIEKIRRKKSNE